MFSWLSGGVVGAVENIAKEWIDTDIEKAEASALMIKTLDPNGLMRRQISRTVSSLYVFYILLVLILVLVQSFGLSPMIENNGVKVIAVTLAIDSLKELFVPITTAFTAIVGASFGVNGMNSYRSK
jgi:hypothetical protein